MVMDTLFASLVLFLVMATHSNAASVYCLCKEGVSQSSLQKALDYACGAGADCSAIHQNKACYTPNTVKNHCDYAVNSYFQKKGQVPGSCNFSGSATTSSTLPTQATGCVYQSTPGSTTPSTTTTATGFLSPPGTGFRPSSFDDNSVTKSLPASKNLAALSWIVISGLLGFVRI